MIYLQRKIKSYQKEYILNLSLLITSNMRDSFGCMIIMIFGLLYASLCMSAGLTMNSLDTPPSMVHGTAPGSRGGTTWQRIPGSQSC